MKSDVFRPVHEAVEGTEKRELADISIADPLIADGHKSADYSDL